MGRELCEKGRGQERAIGLGGWLRFACGVKSLMVELSLLILLVYLLMGLPRLRPGRLARKA